MSEGELLSIEKEINKIVSSFSENSTIQDVVFEIVASKKVSYLELRDRAIYSDYIELLKKRFVTINMAYQSLAEKYDLKYITIKLIVLKRSKCI